jgi:hypothetical protein
MAFDVKPRGWKQLLTRYVPLKMHINLNKIMKLGMTCKVVNACGKCVHGFRSLTNKEVFSRHHKACFLIVVSDQRGVLVIIIVVLYFCQKLFTEKTDFI